MDVDGLMKRYYLKVALPLILLALLFESAVNPTTWLGSRVAYWVQAGNAGRFLSEKGG